MASDRPAAPFETRRAPRRVVVYRMQDPATDAADAGQEASPRRSRSDASEMENLGGWLQITPATRRRSEFRARSHGLRLTDGFKARWQVNGVCGRRGPDAGFETLSQRVRPCCSSWTR